MIRLQNNNKIFTVLKSKKEVSPADPCAYQYLYQNSYKHSSVAEVTMNPALTSVNGQMLALPVGT